MTDHLLFRRGRSNGGEWKRHRVDGSSDAQVGSIVDQRNGLTGELSQPEVHQPEYQGEAEHLSVGPK